jgi:hypothetical protein
MLRTSPLRQLGSASTRRAYAATLTPLSQRCQSLQQPVQQKRQAHAISNPTLANIEKRWEAMPPQEQADLWMALRDRMKVDWNELTLQEKKAGMLHTLQYHHGATGTRQWGILGGAGETPGCTRQLIRSRACHGACKNKYV